jgi:TonB family protein
LSSTQQWTPPVAPLYTKDPVVPPEVAQAGLTGEVTLEFAVDEQGYVVDPRVASSTAEALNPAALDMIRQFRYAPRFVDGKLVLTDGVDYTIRFGVVEASRPTRFQPGFDGFGRANTRWRLEQTDRPDSGFDNPYSGAKN